MTLSLLNKARIMNHLQSEFLSLLSNSHAPPPPHYIYVERNFMLSPDPHKSPLPPVIPPFKCVEEGGGEEGGGDFKIHCLDIFMAVGKWENNSVYAVLKCMLLHQPF